MCAYANIATYADVNRTEATAMQMLPGKGALQDIEHAFGPIVALLLTAKAPHSTPCMMMLPHEKHQEQPHRKDVQYGLGPNQASTGASAVPGSPIENLVCHIYAWEERRACDKILVR